MNELIDGKALRLVLLVAMTIGGTAFAQEADETAWRPLSLSHARLPDLVLRGSEGRLVGGSGGGAFHVGGPRGGLLFGLDLGGALSLPFGGVEPAVGFGLGAEVGYQTAQGLAIGLRYDDLGLGSAAVGVNRFQFATFAVRYTFPYPIPMPYVEAAAGIAFVSSSGPLGSEVGTTALGPGGALGAGIAIPLSHYVAIDVGLRDWIAPVDGIVVQVLSLEAGMNLTLGGAPSPR